MKRVVVLLLMLAGTLASAQSVPQASTHILEGKVVLVDTGEGIAGVQVSVICLPGRDDEAVVAMAERFTAAIRTGTPLRDIVASLNLPPRYASVMTQMLSGAPAGIPAEQLGGFVAVQAQEMTRDAARIERELSTDAAGAFSVTGLSPGSCSIDARRNGYFGAPLPGVDSTITMSTASASALISADTAVASISVPMIHVGTISGRVRDAAGQPMVGMEITATQYGQYDSRTGAPTLRGSGGTRTDANGDYRIPLPPGEYYVVAQPGRQEERPRRFDAYATTFHPNAPAVRTATPLVVAGADLTADITLLPADRRVTGRVLDLTGQPTPRTPSSPSFYLAPADLNVPLGEFSREGVEYPNRAADRSNGHFELRNVPPGDYELIVTVPGSAGQPMPGRIHVDLSKQDAEDLSITIGPGFDVKVRLTIDGAVPVNFRPGGTLPPIAPSLSSAQMDAALRAAAAARPSIVLNLSPSRDILHFSPPANARVSADANAVYTFSHVPEGRYTIQTGQGLGTQDGYGESVHIADVRSGGRSVFADGFLVNGDLTQEIEVVVSTKGQRIEGTVHDAAGTPVNSWIVLVPDAPHRKNPILYKSTGSWGSAGQFAFIGVAAGEYTVFAWNEEVHVGDALNAAFLAKYEGKGKRITVGPGAPLHLDLAVIRKTDR